MARRTARRPARTTSRSTSSTSTSSDEMQGSFLEYAYSVIYSRALPDARDGLKPVQRRILYTMDEMGLRPDRGHVKCARVVGEVMGQLHPHGDGAIYDALVRMAQPFSMRLPLVDGHGNFGSLDDAPGRDALHRVPAWRRRRVLMTDVASTRTPSTSSPTTTAASSSRRCCPRRSPTCWSTAPAGIAVGMATNMAPHNLVEVDRSALRHLITHPERRPRRPDAVRPRPRPADRRQDRRPRRHPRRLRDRPRHRSGCAPPPGSRTSPPRRKGIVVTELPYGVGPEKVIEQDQGPGPGQEAAGHRRRQGPHRPRATACGWSSRSRTASTPRRSSSSSTG